MRGPRQLDYLGQGNLKPRGLGFRVWGFGVRVWGLGIEPTKSAISRVTIRGGNSI